MPKTESKFLDKTMILRLARERYGDFWDEKNGSLEYFIDKLISEINNIESCSEKNKLTSDEAKKIKAIWVVSGVGTYKKPIINTPGDLAIKDKDWMYFSDKARIDHSARVIKQISLALLGSSINEFCPYLIYNGTKEQNSDLTYAIDSGELLIPKDKLFIPEENITNTLDQVESVELPKQMRFEKDDVIGIVSHAPHLARVLRMINKYKPFPEGLKVKLFPIVFKDRANEAEFAQSEIMGILGYISKGEADEEAYPYSL